MVNINTTVQFVLDFKTLLSLVLQLSKEHRELLVSISVLPVSKTGSLVSQNQMICGFEKPLVR